jgi:hypothetical protein
VGFLESVHVLLNISSNILVTIFRVNAFVRV